MPYSDADTMDDYFNDIYNYTIETGETKYLKFLIRKYKNKLNNSHIVIANNIIFQLTQESFEAMDI